MVWPKRFQPSSARALFGRIPHGIPREKVCDLWWLGFYLVAHTYRHRSMAGALEGALRFNEILGKHTLKHLSPEIDTLYIVGPSVEMTREAKRRGLRIIVEQVNAPAPVIMKILGEEGKEFPEIAQDEYDNPIWDVYCDLERQEWELADLIICGSNFVLDGIREVGGPADKVTVVPYGVSQQSEQERDRRRQRQRRKFVVVFVGRVDLRKGAHHLIEAARLMEKDEVEIRLVGPVHLPSHFVSKAPKNVTFVGRVPRPAVIDEYRNADAFCLPSLCEGSATVTYEAMAMGLPVIATHNTGSIVRDGSNGYLVPIRDPSAIVEAIRTCQARLAEDPAFPENPGNPPPYSLEAYRERLLAAVSQQPAVAIR
jgi:glycosyltransferase involved in cell wall biosynthesis